MINIHCILHASGEIRDPLWKWHINSTRNFYRCLARTPHANIGYIGNIGNIIHVNWEKGLCNVCVIVRIIYAFTRESGYFSNIKMSVAFVGSNYIIYESMWLSCNRFSLLSH